VGHSQVKLYGGLLVENLVQALARDVLAVGLERILAGAKTRGLRLQFVLTVHDEVVFLVEEDAVEAAKAWVLEALTADVPWLPGCPIGAEVGAGPNYGEAK